MKRTSKLLTAVSAIALLFFTTSIKAQDSKNWRLGLSLNPGVATKDPYGFVLGGDLRLQKDFAGPISGTLTTGFTHFFVKDDFKDTPADQPYNVIPLKAGIKAFLNKNFYLQGEAGAGFSTDDGMGTSFVWSPAIGWAFNNGLDVGVKYEDYTKYDATKQVALRIAYGFNLSH